MTNRKESARIRILRPNISFTLLTVLFVSSVFFSERIFRPETENSIDPPAMQLTASQIPTGAPSWTGTLLPPMDAPAPAFTPTSLPFGSTLTSTASGLNEITLTGTTDEKYGFMVPNHTLFNATNWTSNAIGPSPGGTTTRAVEVYATNQSVDGLASIAWQGGVIAGSIPPAWTWRETHEFGGGGFFIFNTGPVDWRFIRIHNVEDGIKLREEPEYSNTGSWMIRDCYFTAIRDDAIDNDRFEPGTVQDCLFDGVYVFLSEQDENVGSNNPVGPNEDDTIYIKRVYVRLYGTNDAEGPGKWFKWPGSVPHHRVVISNSVFAIGSVPRLGWSDEAIPPEVHWVGKNNFILWLGAPGDYGGPKPEGVTFLEGAIARAKWVSIRNKWLTDHGLPAQNLPADYNPHEAPIMQIPTGD